MLQKKVNKQVRAGAHGPAGPALVGPLFSHLNLQKDRDTLIEQSSHYTLIEQSW